jgi:Tfp pilus assembly protein FimT
MRSGFTLIELVLVVGLMMIVATASMSIGSSWYNLNNFDSAFSMTVSSLRKAQAYAIDKKNNTTWGVCLSDRTIRLFSGSCASPVIKNDYLLPDNAVISGLSTVTFSNLRGEPSSAQTITLTVAGKSKTISINLLGGFDIN